MDSEPETEAVKIVELKQINSILKQPTYEIPLAVLRQHGKT